LKCLGVKWVTEWGWLADVYSGIILNKERFSCKIQYSVTPIIRINWNGKASGFAEIPENLIYLWK
jgi:hypothetical protein